MIADLKLPDGVPDIATAQELTLNGTTMRLGDTVATMVDNPDLVISAGWSGGTLEEVLDFDIEPGNDKTLTFNLAGMEEVLVGIGGYNETDTTQKLGDLPVRALVAYFDLDLIDDTFGADPAKHKDLLDGNGLYFGYPIDDFLEDYGHPEDVGAFGSSPFGTISYTYQTKGSYDPNMVEFAQAQDKKFYLYSYYLRGYPDDMAQYIK